MEKKVELALVKAPDSISPTPSNPRHDFFTVGSTKDEVLAVQGTPDEFTDMMFKYGLSKVFFCNGRVESWEQSTWNPLKVKLLPTAPVTVTGFFTVGSTRDEVLAVQGTPDELTDKMFKYGLSKVFFRNGRVESWEQSTWNPLKVKLLPTAPVTVTGFFTVGSTRDEVLAVQGTPDELTDKMFKYGLSKVFFCNGRVESWDQSPWNPLKVKLLPTAPVTVTGFFTVGSTRDEVLAVQGTPDEFSDTMFRYGLSRVFFRNGRVESWDQSPWNPLKVSEPRSPPK